MHDQLALYLSATCRRWFSVVCDQSFTVRDCSTMVFSILAQTLRVRLVCDQPATNRPPVGNQSPTSGRQSVQIGEIANTCCRTVADWSPMGRDVPFRWFCEPIVAHQKYDRSQTNVTATFVLSPWSPMVFGGRRLFWSQVVGNRSYPRCDWAFRVTGGTRRSCKLLGLTHKQLFYNTYHAVINSI